MIINSPYITGSLTVTGNANVQGTLTVTGSLSGTATSASLALNSNLLQGTGSIGFATTASFNAVSSSQQQISASLLNVIANYATTGSNSFRANQSITGSLVVSSTITAQTLVVQTVTSSIVFSSGSNTFGNQLANNQTFTGSVNITGSLALAGNSFVNGNLNIGSNTAPATTRLFIQGDASVLNAILTTSANSGISTLSVNIDRGLQGGINLVADKTNQLARIQVTNSDFWPLIFQVRGADGINERMRITNIGSVGIGATSLTQYSLRVSKNITGATTAFAIRQDGVVQSDVTIDARGYHNSLSTAASAFTLANYYHYIAVSGAIGAGSAVTNQFGFTVDSLTGATNNYAFFSNINAGIGRWNLYMAGTAANYLAGNTGIGNSPNFVSAGSILTTTLTNGGSDYVDGTYTDVAATNISSNGVYALFTIVVSGGIVTTATLTWGGTTYRAGDTVTVSNTLLGGTGSGLIITVDTVDSSILTVASTTGGDITLYRNDTSSVLGENIGTIKWESRDSSLKSSGIGAKIGAFSAGTFGGAYLSFFTRSATAGTSLVEAMRIDASGSVGIGLTSPRALLHISGSSLSASLFQVSSTSNNNALVVSGSGNVGVSKANPAATLDVSGSMLVTGSYAMSGSFTQVGYKILTTVSQSLNYSDDTAAAAGGIPLGGLYRNGNFILIRLS